MNDHDVPSVKKNRKRSITIMANKEVAAIRRALSDRMNNVEKTPQKRSNAGDTPNRQEE